jgi:4-amino-4-deoxy-L-arabinose transferase-like glycosyltransferase
MTRWLTAAMLGVTLLVAAALRVVGSGYGLPYPLLNPDEGNIVPRAWDLVHGGGLDPGWYDYPSLLFLLLSPTQVLSDGPSYGAARVVAVGIGLAGVAAAWWLGRAAFGRRAALVGAVTVAVATTHVAYSRMAVTDVLLTTLATAALALLVSGRLEWAGLAVGLAVSAKYPGIALCVPLVVAGWGRWRALTRSLAIAAAAFFVTSPFVVIHAGRAWSDISRVQDLARLGWLGFEDDRGLTLAFVDRLWGALGPLLVVALVALVVALRRRSPADVVLLAFVAAYWLELVPVNAPFDRYVLPLVPVLGVLAGSVRILAPVALAALLVPAVWSIDDALLLRHEDTRLAADAWIAGHVPASDLIVADPSTLPLAGRKVLRLQLPGPGRPFDPNRDLDRLRREGAVWLLASGAVTDRVTDEPGRYPREAAFYRSLAALDVAFSASSAEPGLSGPWVRVYRLR